MLPPLDPNLLWMVIVGFVIAFLLAFAVGANDVANSFGTSVGSKVLTLRQACCIATVCETLGAILIGMSVSDTVWKGIVEISLYDNKERTLMLGEIAALSGAGAWLLTATMIRLPISATHSIVGATVGFSLVEFGSAGIKWEKIGRIIASWFVSPILSGCVSSALFILVRRFILEAADPLESGLRAMPIFYAATLFTNLTAIFLGGSSLLGFDQIPWWGALILSSGLATIVALLVMFFLVPWKRRKILEQMADTKRKHEELEQLQRSGDPVAAQVVVPGPVAATAAPSLHDSGLGAEEGDSQLGASRRYSFKRALSEGKELNRMAGAKEDEPTRLLPLNNGHVKGQTEEVIIVDSQKQSPLNRQKSVDETADRKASGFSRCWEKSQKTHTKIFGTSGPTHQEEAQLSPAHPPDRPEANAVFSYLQIMTASFASFAHGGNDVSNAIGPLIALWVIYQNGQIVPMTTPIWILFYGGAGISIGLWVLGRKVIQTIAIDLTPVIPSSGFCIELGTATTVLVASKIGLPISTTHCIVGSVVSVGWFRSRAHVDWKLFRNIAFAWVFTLPATIGFSAAFMALLRMLA